MKNCYFFPAEKGIWAQGKRKTILIPNPIYTNDGKQDIIKVQDADTGKYFYPASDCKKVQY